MCVMSMIGDHYTDKWKGVFYPSVVPSDTAGAVPSTYAAAWSLPVSRAEFEELQRDVQEMKKLLERAKQYDEDHGEPGCELEEKIGFLRKVAELLGVDLDEVLP